MTMRAKLLLSVLLGVLANPAFAQIGTGQLRVIPKLKEIQPAGTRALRCRGGPVDFINFVQYSATTSVLMVDFSKGTKPAGKGLAPGECSWVDGAMTNADPPNLCQSVDHVFITVQHVYDSKYTPSDLWLLQSAWSKAAPWLEGIRSPDKTFGFYVANEGNNCLVIKGQF